MLDERRSILLLIDLQEKLMPAIADGPAVVEQAARLARAARLLGIPILATEQYPKGLGGTVPALAGAADRTIAKRSFDATRDPGLLDALPMERPQLVVCGAEAHVCVLQTALGLLAAGRQISVVADAIGSRAEANRQAGLDRLARRGAEIVTAEMVMFEWLGTSDRPEFRDVLALIR